MSGEVMNLIAFTFCLVVVTGVLLYVIYRQQQQIDTLTDRLMARSYTEYKKADSVIKEDDISPVQEDDPKGWFDH